VKTVAFHVFVDLQSLLSGRDAELLTFIDELTTVSSSNQYVPPDGSESSDESEDRSDGDMSTPPATPRAYQDSGLRHREQESAKERHRLERLVLEDLNLTLDYFPEPVKKPSTTTVKSRQKVPLRMNSVGLSSLNCI
jgi:autophagy-related protein 2